jgi:hypothetical protein
MKQYVSIKKQQPYLVVIQPPAIKELSCAAQLINRVPKKTGITVQSIYTAQ